MATDENYSGLFWGFVDDAYSCLFDPHPETAIEKKIKKYENMIRTNKDWFTSIQKKAFDQNIPVDSMLRMDAIWMVKQDEKDEYSFSLINPYFKIIPA